MRNDRPNYTPGFAEDKIPVPFAWFDWIAPKMFLCLAIAAWGIVFWRAFA